MKTAASTDAHTNRRRSSLYYWTGFFNTIQPIRQGGLVALQDHSGVGDLRASLHRRSHRPRAQLQQRQQSSHELFLADPGLPALHRGSVLRYTQTRADIDSQLVEGDSWEMYAAPHPPMHLKAMDYDRHQISHYDPLTASARGMSNLRLECFELLNAPIPRDMLNQGPWPESVQWRDGPGQRPRSSECKRYFDSNGSPGAQFKFDFDFGNNPNVETRTVELQKSPVFRNQFYLCADGSALMLTAVDKCVGAKGEEVIVAQGNRMFTQHVLNTVDFPFVDVGNRDSRFPCIVNIPSWRLSEKQVDVDGSLLGRHTLASPEAAICHQKFVTALDSVPDAQGAVATTTSRPRWSARQGLTAFSSSSLMISTLRSSVPLGQSTLPPLLTALTSARRAGSLPSRSPTLASSRVM
jgi:hypothetical protein